MRPELGAAYKSPSQKARVISEDWAKRALYCLACSRDHLIQYDNNRAVLDFRCPGCGADYQLKGKKRAIGRTIRNSAYEKKMEALRRGAAPHYVFISYDAPMSHVTQGFVVPGHFITPTIVTTSSPLRETARRRGWVGSNLMLGLLPPDARIYIVKEGRARPMDEVRRAWSRFRFLKDEPADSRGWLTDVLAAIRELDQPRFRTLDAYAFEARLAKLHPNNRNVRPKIRQQLQQLRNRGIVRFLDRGEYEII